MANLNSFTHPATFRRIQPQYLRAWLLPWSEYLAGRGFTLPEAHPDVEPTTPHMVSSPQPSPGLRPPSPAPASEGQSVVGIDYERLAAIFMEPDPAMPRPMMHSASMIHEMANEDAMRFLIERARMERVQLDVGDDPDAADVAVQLWLQDPDLLEELHNMHQLDRPRSFVHFTTDRHPVPAFHEPSDVKMTELEAALGEWNFKAKRGRHVRVWMYRRPDEYWFLVRHGLSSRRQEVISPTGSETLILRPGEYDVVVYNSARGELRIHGCNPTEVEMLRSTFAEHLFDDPEFFPGGAKFTLAPLVANGRACLVCTDVPELANVTCVAVQFFKGGKKWLRHTFEAPDVFDAIDDGDFSFPAPDMIVRATFLIRFKDSRKQRTVTIAGSNRLKVVRDGDTVLLERWLAARGFVMEPVRDEVETGTLAGA